MRVELGRDYVNEEDLRDSRSVTESGDGEDGGG